MLPRPCSHSLLSCVTSFVILSIAFPCCCTTPPAEVSSRFTAPLCGMPYASFYDFTWGRKCCLAAVLFCVPVPTWRHKRPFLAVTPWVRGTDVSSKWGYELVVLVPTTLFRGALLQYPRLI